MVLQRIANTRGLLEIAACRGKLDKSEHSGGPREAVRIDRELLGRAPVLNSRSKASQRLRFEYFQQAGEVRLDDRAAHLVRSPHHDARSYSHSTRRWPIARLTVRPPAIWTDRRSPRATSSTRSTSALDTGGEPSQRRTARRASASGIEASSRALLSNGPDTEPLYREAVERLERSRGVVHLARAQLLYGEWLRRENRRVDAREQLRAAYERFEQIGAEAFAERARRELVATGETAPRRTVETRDVLTPQEAQIARMASDRQTNPEIGATLFISPRTVEYHLRKVFTKLDISSRKELQRALAGIPDADKVATP